MPGQFNPNDYEPVQDRIRKFWTEHPDGAILTSLQSDPANFEACRYKAEIYVTDRLVATGWAFEKVGRAANSTHHEENAETSAIGRALANMGYATSAEKRPSREEVGKVERTNVTPIRTAAPEPEAERIDTDKVKAIQQLCDRKGVSAQTVCDGFGVESLLALNVEQYWRAHKRLTARPDVPAGDRTEDAAEQELAKAEAIP
jgi:hypothetical protein